MADKLRDVDLTKSNIMDGLAALPLLCRLGEVKREYERAKKEYEDAPCSFAEASKQAKVMSTIVNRLLKAIEVDRLRHEVINIERKIGRHYKWTHLK